LSQLNLNRLIFSSSFEDLLEGDRIVMLEGGSREGLDEPWQSLEARGCLKVIGFEPDIEECERLNAVTYQTRTYLPKALWNKEGEIGVHIGACPSASSVYPPNPEFLRKYEQPVWEPRVTAKYVSVECTTIDRVLETDGSDCDFLKLDIHSAEYEALQGALASLKTKIFAVLVESWSAEYHKGQRLTGDILTLMNELGFSFFDLGIAAGGRRRFASTLNLYGKQQIHGLDLLFFKEPAVFATHPNPVVKLIKAAAIAELYGFPDYAIEILRHEAECKPQSAGLLNPVIQTIVKNAQTPPFGGFPQLH
jgi:FkbM family methyltransferase